MSMEPPICRRFESGARRHIAAMAAFPDSRLLEVLPLQFLVPRTSGLLLDLFAGTGLVTNSIGSRFSGVVLIDSHVTLSEPALPHARRIRGDALREETFKGLPEADLAVCLAGLHHILGETGAAEDRETLRGHRVDALRLWRRRLNPGGRLVVADVPVPGSTNPWMGGAWPQEVACSLPEPRPFGSANPSGENDFGALTGCRSLDDYLCAIRQICARLRLGECEPAAFFDEVISRLSPHGHVAEFCSPEELAELFREAGFANVSAFVAPTPWLFGSKTDALWFIHELLSIGRPCESPALLDKREVGAVEEGIADHLGLRRLPDDRWAIAWKLMYVVGERP